MYLKKIEKRLQNKVSIFNYQSPGETQPFDDIRMTHLNVLIYCLQDKR